jgi:hypothetical protein
MNPKPILLFIVIFITNKYLFNKNINYTDLIILTIFITFIAYLLDNILNKNIKYNNVKNLNNY